MHVTDFGAISFAGQLVLPAEPLVTHVAILVVGMRALLRYLHLAGITGTALAGVVPSAASWPAGVLPRPIDLGQPAQLMSSCDRRTAVGRRDFAVAGLPRGAVIMPSIWTPIPYPASDSTESSA